jgi:hypothetical protein
MNRMKAAAAVALLIWIASPAIPHAQQAPPQAQTPAAQGTPATRPPRMLPSEAPRGQAVAQGRRSSGALQGFSVVLVVGELQGTSATDDVPAAAKKALADMREFLPYKSYRLLDAGWLMCCGEPARTTSERRPESSTLALRGPDDHEYELHLTTSRGEGGRVLVQFNLIASVAAHSATAATASTPRTLQRRLADLEDKSEMLRKQIADAKRRVDVGVAPGTEIPKLELELRSIQREVVELRERLESNTASRGGGVRGSTERNRRRRRVASEGCHQGTHRARHRGPARRLGRNPRLSHASRRASQRNARAGAKPLG